MEEYNFSSGALPKGSFVSGNTANVTQIVEVDGGELTLTQTDQPIYIKNRSFEGWLHDPQNLTTADSILDPVNQSWIRVTSVQLVADDTVVFDVVTSGENNFVANGMLLDVKVD